MKQTERGSLRMTALAGALVGGALLAGAYGVGQQPASAPATPVAAPPPPATRAPGPSPAPTRLVRPGTPTPAASPTVALPRAIPVRAYRFAIQTTRLDGQDPLTMTVQGAWTTESLHMITTITLAAGTREETEVYVAAGRTVWRTGAGPWQTTQTDTAPPDKLDLNRLLVQARTGAGLDLAFVETAIARGVVCQKYRYRIPADPTGEAGFIYVGSNGLIYRLEGATSGPTGPTARLLLEQWDYNAAIVIRPPI